MYTKLNTESQKMMKTGRKEMMITLVLGLVLGLVLAPTLNLSPGLQAQEVTTGYQPKSRILFIFDASNSMAGQWEGARKIDIAREILFEMVDSLEQMPNVEMALRIYGHQSPVPPQDCA